MVIFDGYFFDLSVTFLELFFISYFFSISLIFLHLS